MKVLLKSADGLSMEMEIEDVVKPPRELFRHCSRILQLEGKTRFGNELTPTPVRKYVLWTTQNNQYVYREDL